MKTCSKCGVEKDYSNFRTVRPGKGCKMNLHSWCYDCKRAARRMDYQNNRDRYSENNKNYRRANPDYFRAQELNRRALKKNAEGTITRAVIGLLFETYGTSCLRCGSNKSVEIDHVVPLTKGGSNLLENLQPLCKSCNLQKGNRSSADYRNKGEGRPTS